MQDDIVADLTKQLSDERQRYEDLLALFKNKLAKSHSCVDNAVLKWTEGHGQALTKSVFGAWRHITNSQARKARAHQNVEMAMLKWIEGDKKGLMHSVLQPWKAVTESARIQRKEDQFQKFLADQ